MAKNHVILGASSAEKKAAKRRKGYILLGTAAGLATPPILMAIENTMDHPIEKAIMHLINAENAPGHEDHPEKTIFLDYDNGYLTNETGAHYKTKEGKEIKLNETGEISIIGGSGVIEKNIKITEIHKYLEDKDGTDFNILPHQMVEKDVDGGQGNMTHGYQYTWEIAHSEMPDFAKHMVKAKYDKFAGKEKAGSGKIIVKYDPDTKLIHGDIIIDGAVVYENITLGFDEDLEGFEHSALGEAQDHFEDGKDGDDSYKPYLKEFIHKATIDHMSHKLNAANEKIVSYEDILTKADKEADDFKNGNWSDIPDRIHEANDYIKELKGYLDEADKVANQYKGGNWSDLDDRIQDMLDELNGLKGHISDLNEKYTQNWNMDKDLFGQVYGHLTSEEKIVLQEQGFEEILMDDNESNGEMINGSVQIIPTQDHSFIYIQKGDQVITMNVSRELGEKVAALAYEHKGQDVDHQYGYTPVYLDSIDSHEQFVKSWDTAMKNHWHKTLYKTEDNGDENETGTMEFKILHKDKGVEDFDVFYKAWEDGKIHYIEIADTGDDAVNGGYAVARDINHRIVLCTPITIDNIETIREHYQGK